MNESSDPKFIIPPGLCFKVKEFEAHYKVARGAPIMICGHSGTGKSLFLHLFKMLYRKDYGENSQILTVNCSHFEGDLARSELFGHTRGAFTGASSESEGWIKKADGGVIILEEIGELAKETQAKLLTFIETGEFHKVGSSNIEKASVQIVGATNNEKNLREDFRYRFFPFHIPPIHERRQDVLYYLAARFPQLIKSLTPWEVLALIAYNWPGNVREIERIGRLLERRKLIIEEDPCFELLEEAVKLLHSDHCELSLSELSHTRELVRSGLGSLDQRYMTLISNQAYRLYSSMERNGVDVKHLESLLNTFRLGLSIQNNSHSLVNSKKKSFVLNYTIDPRFCIGICSEVQAFKDAYSGLRVFCSLFCQHEMEDENLLNVLETTFRLNTLPIKHLIKSSKENLALVESILVYIKSQKLSSKQQEGAISSISSMTRDELLQLYYVQLLRRTGGNQAKAAKMAGVHYTTFRDYLKKHNLI